MPKTKLEHLVDHYNKTYDLTYKMWEQRNRLFIFLVLSISLAVFLVYFPQDTRPLLVDFIAGFARITDVQRVAELRTTFPYATMQATILLLVFYLMVNLFHRSLYVLRNYIYLGKLEDDIQDALELSKKQIGFSREGDYYWSERPWLLSLTKWTYILLVGILLFSFLGGLTYGDWIRNDFLLFGIDVLVGVPTLVFYFGYAYYSISLDKEG